MNNINSNIHPVIIPALRYLDGQAAISWLCNAFGFEKQLLVLDKKLVAHAQLTYGNSMIMLGAAKNNAFSKLVKSPLETGCVGSQSVYVIVEDVDAHYAKAVAAGAVIVLDIHDEDYGGRAYSCRDPEGHVWNFGGYNPWIVNHEK